jgi:CubicO group peptidase (beta-lactamase class C family)
MRVERSNRGRRWLLGLAGVLILVLMGHSRAADLGHQAIPGASPEPVASAEATTPEEMEAFVDGWMAWVLPSKPVAGAVVSVVKDGRLFFAKGYGYADVARHAAVNPDTTLFRVGSVTKVITWIAIMQLVEQGKLDLDGDVNQYLKGFRIPASYPQPITIRNLMTHSGGLEDGGIGYLEAPSLDQLVPLQEWLVKHMPTRVRPPTHDFTLSTNVAYSNWGATLAGYIVACVSGMSYDDYVEQRILAPLGMTHSTFNEPLPNVLATNLSTGYTFENNELRRAPFELTHNAAPAASLSATATDMAKLEVAMLQDGALGTTQILTPPTARLMQARALSPDPALNGLTLGLFETWINGTRVVGHGGDTEFFHSEFEWMPQAHLGLFVSFNTDRAGASATNFFNAFYQHYFPARLPAIKPPAEASARNARYEGTYRPLRRSYTKLDKILALGDTFDVTPMPDGTLSFPDPASQKPQRWIEVRAGVFRAATADILVAFKGPVDHAQYLVGPEADLAADRVPWYGQGFLHGILLTVGTLLFVSMMVSAVRHRAEDQARVAVLRWARTSLALAGAAFIGFFVLAAVALAGGVDALILRIPWTLSAALTLPLLAIVPTAAAVYYAFIIWRTGAWSLRSRLHYTATAVFALVFLWIFAYWNLLGYRYG